MTRKLTHLRYIVYFDESSKIKVDLWCDEIVHKAYEKKHNIDPQIVSSLGYIGVYEGHWIFYEHYQLQKPEREVYDKAFVMQELLKRSEFENDTLKNELAKTYQEEKNLFLCVCKRDIAEPVIKAAQSLKKLFDRACS